MNHDIEGLDINPKRIPTAIALWGLGALVVAIFFTIVNSSSLVTSANIFIKGIAILFGALFGTIGALIGDALRRFANPSAVYTSGGFFSLIWIKLFWLCGPQVIGLVGGTFVGSAIIYAIFQ